MPIYVYHCKKCQEYFEKNSSIVNRDKAKCPRCKRKGKRQLNKIPVHFNAGGFYASDNKRQN